ncbi:MAG: hypothetical protein F6J93_00505 [Oscillatoria sp. SIO1A7]|nr:hypothetical protein [Oscillatoria sp. SIO1A7]
MLSQPIFDDSSLAESFYSAIFELFCRSCQSEVRELLSECRFGIAPLKGNSDSGPSGEKTFFIVAPCLDVAEQLLQEADSIIEQVANIMAGVEQTVICILPNGQQDLQQFPPKSMVGKIFRNRVE